MTAATLNHLIPAARTTTTTASSIGSNETGAVAGVPRLLLRLEGAALLALTAWAYGHFALAGWGLFAALFLVPDAAFLAYLAGPRSGAIAYNATHSLIGPALLGAMGVLLGAPTLLAIALVWTAHVGFDRMMGYGLKYGTAFGATHLGRVGAAAAV
jgi:hypothetical protein